MLTKAKSFTGHPFLVVDPASIGLPAHTTHTFDDHEPTLALLEQIKPGDVFIDVGAQFGSYSLPALAMGAMVLAFEPADDESTVLTANVIVNGWESRCDVVKAVAWDGSEPPHALFAEVFGQHYKAESLRTTTIDTQVSLLGIGRVDWMKLDPEGSELGVLRGAIDTLTRWRPRLIIEDHQDVDPPGKTQICDYPKSVNSSEEIRKMLTGLGYRIDVVPWDVSRKFLVCEAA